MPGQASYSDNHRLTIQLPLGSAGDTFKSSELILEAYQRSGVDLSTMAIGNQFTVQQLYGIETLAFYSIRLQGRLPALGGTYKLGRFSSGDDFATWPYYTLAMNNAIDGNPQSLPVNTGFSSFPNAVWGATVNLAVGDQTRRWPAADQPAGALPQLPWSWRAHPTAAGPTRRGGRRGGAGALLSAASPQAGARRLLVALQPTQLQWRRSAGFHLRGLAAW